MLVTICALSIAAFFLLGILWQQQLAVSSRRRRRPAAAAEKRFENIPTLGYAKNSPLRNFVSAFRCFFRTDEWFAEGYKKYSATETPFHIPNFFSFKPFTILPSSYINEIHSAPEAMLSMIGWFEDESSAEHVFFSRDLVQLAYPVEVLKHGLAKKLSQMIPKVEEEGRIAFEAVWGEEATGEGPWKEVRLLEMAHGMVPRTTWRCIAGIEICRNKEFVKNAVDYAVGVMMVGWGLRNLPLWMRRFVAPILNFKNRSRVKFAVNVLRPMIEKRMQDIEYNSVTEFEKLPEPDDILQWCLYTARSMGPRHYNVRAIVLRLLFINWAAVHTTSQTFTNAMLELAHSGTGEGGYIEELAEEVKVVIAEEKKIDFENGVQDKGDGGTFWTKKRLGKLVGMDSFLKETLRMYLVGEAIISRKVVPSEGYTFKSGFHLPQGSTVCVPAKAVHYDNNIYPEAEKFKGWRFSTPYKGSGSTSVVGEGEGTTTTAVGGGFKSLSMTATTNTFLAFGRGKHSCPGRLLAAAELKLFLVHILENYDFEPRTDERPKTWFMWLFQVAPLDCRIWMKKKESITDDHEDHTTCTGTSTGAGARTGTEGGCGCNCGC